MRVDLTPHERAFLEGAHGEAAAMAMIIVATSFTVRMLHALLMRALNARHSAWRTRTG